MNTILQLSFVLLTVIAYVISKKIYGKINWGILSPLIICPLIIIIFLSVFHISYEQYAGGGYWLTKMLEPAVVAFAFPLYQYRKILKEHAVLIIANVFVGSAISIFISVILSKCFHVSWKMSESIAPHIVTTPIAMDISSMTGGMEQLTALFVILTALIAAITGPVLIRFMHIKTSIAKGIALGTSGNGTGTSKAFEMGPLEGTIATIAMLLTGIFSLLLVPLILGLLI
ncbi:LrgB family protein [Rummeliibacillus pycnus]|uniref:LrgB family protein n=1 Tax=Rummeliibacillus pycnus TaxID=101070 RepID=UPI000C9AA83F|nr:LrgB family protein [Rummeliibacillus pycnus]